MECLVNEGALKHSVHVLGAGAALWGGQIAGHVVVIEAGKVERASVDLGQTVDVVMLLVHCMALCVVRASPHQHLQLGPISPHKVFEGDVCRCSFGMRKMGWCR